MFYSVTISFGFKAIFELYKIITKTTFYKTIITTALHASDKKVPTIY